MACILARKVEEFHTAFAGQKSEELTLNDFERLRTLGRGAFGRVILVKSIKDGDVYALKVLSKIEVIKMKQLENVMNEKQILAACNYPFIVRLHHTFKDNSYLYMALEFVMGGEMFSLLRSMRRFPDKMVKFYATQVVLAFEYLHELTIAYRDLKPENLLITADGFLKVADLGFAKMIPKDKRTWTLCGTPDYMAPEIIMSRGYHCAVDWWAFGVLLYEMTAGLPPFMHNDQMKTFESIVVGKVKFTKHFGSDLSNLISNLIQTDLSRRYGNLKNGIADIKKHRYFSDIDWLKIYNKQIEPPHKPKVKGDIDTSHFDKYEEETLKIADTDRFKAEFEQF